MRVWFAITILTLFVSKTFAAGTECIPFSGNPPLHLESINIDPQHPLVTDEVTVLVTVRNWGSAEFDGALVLDIFDVDNNFTQLEHVARDVVVAPGETESLANTFNVPRSGLYSVGFGTFDTEGCSFGDYSQVRFLEVDEHEGCEASTTTTTTTSSTTTTRVPGSTSTTHVVTSTTTTTTRLVDITLVCPNLCDEACVPLYKGRNMREARKACRQIFKNKKFCKDQITICWTLCEASLK